MQVMDRTHCCCWTRIWSNMFKISLYKFLSGTLTIARFSAFSLMIRIKAHLEAELFGFVRSDQLDQFLKCMSVICYITFLVQCSGSRPTLYRYYLNLPCLMWIITDFTDRESTNPTYNVHHLRHSGFIVIDQGRAPVRLVTWTILYQSGLDWTVLGFNGYSLPSSGFSIRTRIATDVSPWRFISWTSSYRSKSSARQTCLTLCRIVLDGLLRAWDYR
jgi:hypothetical protein